MRYAIYKRDDDFSKKMAEEIKDFLNSDPFFSFDQDNPDLVIVIGGDGTFLGAFHACENDFKNKTFLAFNTGTIGYYNEFDVHDYKKILTSIKEGTLPTRDFSLLEFEDGKNKRYCVNEFIISGLIRNVEYDVFLDSEKIEQYFGMGFIVSSSTGSMGYNRSINGSIVDIDNDGMQLTEIAPIRSKAYSPIGSPVVLSNRRTLVFKEKNKRYGKLLIDNMLVEERIDEEFSVRVSKDKIKTYSLERDPFVARLKKTLGL